MKRWIAISAAALLICSSFPALGAPGAPAGGLTDDNIDAFIEECKKEEDFTKMEDVYDRNPGVHAEIQAEAESKKVQTFKGLYEIQDAKYQSLSSFIERNIDKWNEQVMAENPEGYWNDSRYIDVFFWGNMSWELAMVATFDDTATVEANMKSAGMAIKAFGGENLSMEQLAPNDWLVTYDSDGKHIEDYVKTSPENSCMSFVSYSTGGNGKRMPNDFFEFIILGENRYAWQTGNSRIVATIDDEGIVHDFTLAELSGQAERYGEDDSIMPDGTVCSTAWVMERGDAINAVYSYDGSTYTVTADGKTVPVTLEPKDMETPPETVDVSEYLKDLFKSP